MEPVFVKRRNPINKRTKLNLVFDEDARREFLTGFHKRKLQRQKKAQEEFKQKIKEEKKRIKQEAQESYKKMKMSFKPIPEVEELLRTTAKEYDVGDHSVCVVEFSSDVLEKRNKIIGENKVEYEDTGSQDQENERDSDDEVPGMELKTKKEINKEIKKQATLQVKKSKVFQTKNRMEQQKQRKKSLKQKKKKMKIQQKSKKGKRDNKAYR
ncbi:nucleolar protein 12 [Nilaparvata lugens]|uniref:nucleolar protein 12 n=1 Tax=Nilaparvata lugens TaxID=108931 RepID=UPI000B981333|nr:nucleolar protein 12 [Nilaparvata lugens]